MKRRTFKTINVFTFFFNFFSIFLLFSNFQNRLHYLAARPTTSGTCSSVKYIKYYYKTSCCEHSRRDHYRDICFMSLDLGMEELGRMVGACLAFKETTELFSSGVGLFYTFLTNISMVSLFNFRYSNSYIVVSHYGFNFHSPNE